jgi:hypothetical protein
MGNHIHLLLRPEERSISRIVQSLLVSHTHRYHRFHSCSNMPDSLRLAAALRRRQ